MPKFEAEPGRSKHYRCVVSWLLGRLYEQDNTSAAAGMVDVLRLGETTEATVLCMPLRYSPLLITGCFIFPPKAAKEAQGVFNVRVG